MPFRHQLLRSLLLVIQLLHQLYSFAVFWTQTQTGIADCLMQKQMHNHLSRSVSESSRGWWKGPRRHSRDGAPDHVLLLFAVDGGQVSSYGSAELLRFQPRLLVLCSGERLKRPFWHQTKQTIEHKIKKYQLPRRNRFTIVLCGDYRNWVQGLGVFSSVKHRLGINSVSQVTHCIADRSVYCKTTTRPQNYLNWTLRKKGQTWRLVFKRINKTKSISVEARRLLHIIWKKRLWNNRTHICVPIFIGITEYSEL